MEPRALQLVVLTGPTAVGKSALALGLAERFDAEIVSADSRLVYRGLDVGTAEAERGRAGPRAPSFIDLVEPDEPFSVADYQAAAEAVLADVAAAGPGGAAGRRQPALRPGGGGPAGAAARGAPAGAPGELRRSPPRGGRWRSWALGCERLDPAAAARADRSNVRRLIRAIEVVESDGRAARGRGAAARGRSGRRCTWR